MKLYNQELDCLANLSKKLRDSIDAMESEYANTESERYRKYLAPSIVDTRKAMLAAEAAAKALRKIEL